MKTYLIRGVPMSIQRDGWWLNGPAARRPERAQDGKHLPDVARLALLLPLVALGDVLVWQVMPGVSLAVFGAVLILAALWVAPMRLSAQRLAFVAGGSVLALLPLVELVQPLSLLIAVAGLSAMLTIIAGLAPAEWIRGMLRLWPMGVRQTFVDAVGIAPRAGQGDVNHLLLRAVLHWMMPLVLGVTFCLLLLAANPIAARWAEQLWNVGLTLPETARMAFWLCLIPLAWTALSLHQMRERLRAPVPRLPAKMGPAREGLINPGSVIRALVIFNAVFAVQTVMDVIYLYAGVGLPAGITYAEYAHRGAYPLIVTALLAGGFALLTRRWVQGNAMLRAMLMLWVAQNVALVISSIVRLELYIEVYGLTHLRMAAAIWMALVAGGLALILLQVWQGRDNAWLMLRSTALGASVLYACSWVSFDATIARFNLNNAVNADFFYLCNLGDAAVPVIAAHDQRRNVQTCAPHHSHIRAPRDWREWGFRNWRARTSLAAITAEAQTQVSR